MFNQVLVANRGEIACRIIRTLKEMGVKSVAVYSDPDETAAHVLMADEAVRIGPAPAKDSYLNVPAILDAIKSTGAEAVHPGYGFLSENADFAKTLEDNGIAFIGPTPKHLIEFGLKHRSKELAQEFDESLRTIAQLDYGLVMISHATDKVFKDQNGSEYNRIVPTLDKRAKNIVSRMVDLYGYSRIVADDKGNESTKLFLRGTSRYEAGSRFKYTPDYIDFNYNALVAAIGEAIDKQAKEDGTELFTDTRQNLYNDTSAELDFDELKEEFNTLVNTIISVAAANEAEAKYAELITEIIEKYLGKGGKVNEMSRGQVEALSLIVADLKELNVE